MEEVITKVIQADKTIRLFQTMAIVSVNMGNLNLEVNSIKNKLATKEKEKATLQEELDKERDFHEEYKHNIEIWNKQRTENEQKIKMLILTMKEDNKELKEKTRLMKS